MYIIVIKMYTKSQLENNLMCKLYQKMAANDTGWSEKHFLFIKIVIVVWNAFAESLS